MTAIRVAGRIIGEQEEQRQPWEKENENKAKKKIKQELARMRKEDKTIS